MTHRATLKRPVDCEGTGLHCGRSVRMQLKPAAAGHGVRFVRTDCGVEIPASVEYLARLDHATRLSRDGAAIHTVEHLLAALRAMGVDDVLVALDGPEVPVLDGSSEPFVRLIQTAGLRSHDVARQHIKILEVVEVQRGDASVRVTPADDFRVSYTIAFDHPLLRRQSASYAVTAESFASAIAPARTFGFLSEVDALRRNGLALGATLDNAVVIGEHGLLNPLRFEDEFVRHKILDAIGDLSLLGHPLLGHVEAWRAGHALHAALARKLLATPQAWSLASTPRANPVLDRPSPRLVLQPS